VAEDTARDGGGAVRAAHRVEASYGELSPADEPRAISSSLSRAQPAEGARSSAVGAAAVSVPALRVAVGAMEAEVSGGGRADLRQSGADGGMGLTMRSARGAAGANLSFGGLGPKAVRHAQGAVADAAAGFSGVRRRGRRGRPLPSVWVESGSRGELPLFGSSQRSLFALAMWVVAPLVGILFFCLMPSSAQTDEVRGRQPLLLRKRSSGSPSPPESAAAGGTLKIRTVSTSDVYASDLHSQPRSYRARQHQAFSPLSMPMLLCPSLLRYLPRADVQVHASDLELADACASRARCASAASEVESASSSATGDSASSAADRGLGDRGRHCAKLLGNSPLPRPPPLLHGSETEPVCILSAEQRARLIPELPVSLSLSDWLLLYSTEQHGCSLRTFYHHLESAGPSLLLVLDSTGGVFGGFASDPWHVSSHYFGNGESFLFAAVPSWRVHHWSGANSLFQLGSSDSIGFGGGGQFGLWLDESFEFGSTGRSETYENEPLGEARDFRVLRVECWGFTGLSTSPKATAVSEAPEPTRVFSESLIRRTCSWGEVLWAAPTSRLGAFARSSAPAAGGAC